MSEQKQVLVEVTLAKPHTDAGVPYQAGDKIKVSPPVRDWLIANQIAKEGAK